MTASFDDHFDGTGDKWSARVLTRVAHSIIWVLPVVLVLRIIYWVWGQSWTWMAYLSSITWVLLIIAYWIAIFHERAPRLCVRCMAEVPANASERAQGFRRHFLRLLHLSRRTSWMLTALMIGCILIVPVFLRSDTGLLIAAMPIDLFVAASIYGGWLHHRLRPWCPYCRRWGDGGTYELVPDPDPSESRKVPR